MHDLLPTDRVVGAGGRRVELGVVDVTDELAVPAVWTDDGLPVGVQLVGRPFAEATLLQVARQLESAMPWADRRPPAFV